MVQLQRLSAQLSALQRDVQELKRMVAAMVGAPRPALDAARSGVERPDPGTDREAALDLLVDLVRQLRDRGASRIFANVNEEVRLRYGDLPNDRIPYERFKDFVQDAQRRGRIRLVRVGPVDHVLLADEPISSYLQTVRREPEPAQP
jgi:hypothetical protein